MYQIILRQIVGQATDQIWSQVFVLPPLGIQKPFVFSASHPVLVVSCITFRSLSKSGSQEKGNEIVRQISQVFDEFEKKPTELIKTYRGFLSQLKNKIPDQSLELTIGVVVGRDIYIMGLGGGRAVLKRDDKLGVVYKGRTGEVRYIKGRIEVNDRLMLGTEGLVGEMEYDLIRQVLDYDSPEEAVEELAPLIRSQPDNHNVAGAVLHYRAEDQIEGKSEVLDETDSSSTPEVFLKQKKPRKVTVSVGLIILILLLASVVLGWRQRQAIYWQESFEELSGQVIQAIESSERLQENNPVASRQALAQASQLLEENKSKFLNQPKYTEKIEDLERSFHEKSQEILGLRPVEETPIWYELGLVRANMFGTRMSLSGDNLVVLDGQTAVLGVIKVTSKQSELAGGALLRGGIDLGVSGNRAVVLTESGVMEVSISQKTSAALVEPDSEWQSPRNVAIYGGNVYLVDTRSNDIWRYPGIASGVGQRQRWLAAGVEPDLRGVKDMQIDGDIWLLNEDGVILRFRRGNPVSFVVEGLDQPLEGPVAFWVDPEGDEVFVLDRGNRRIVRLNKEGRYQQQYLWDGLSTASDLVVARQIGQILVLAGDTIYAIEL